MSEDLSARQQRILQFLKDFIDEKNYPPSIRDIQQGCGVSSTSVVDYNLKKLEEKGHIRRDREVSRAIELLGASAARRPAPVSVPLLGTIAAGQPIPTPPDTVSPARTRIGSRSRRNRSGAGATSSRCASRGTR